MKIYSFKEPLFLKLQNILYVFKTYTERKRERESKYNIL